MNPHAARRRYVLVQLLTWLPVGVMMPSSILLMTARGLDLGTVGVVFTVQGLLVALLELPTGGLADVLGRRGVLVTAAACSTVALAGAALAVAPWQFVACAVLKAVGRALSSGPAEAWYVDQVHAAHPAGTPRSDEFVRSGLARGGAADGIALCAGSLLGGALPTLAAATGTGGHGRLIPLSVPSLVAAAGMALLLLVVTLALPEPATAHRQRLGAVLRAVPATIADGARLGLRDRTLGRILLLSVAAGVMLSAIELLTPARLAELTGSAERATAVYAVVTAVGFAASAAGSGLSGPTVRLAGSARRGLRAGGAVAVLALCGLAASVALHGVSGVAATCAGYLLLFVGLGIVSPIQSAQLHSRVPAQARATAVSVNSLLLQGSGAAANAGLARLGATGLTWLAWLLSGATVTGALAGYPRADRVDRATSPDQTVEAGLTDRWDGSTDSAPLTNTASLK